MIKPFLITGRRPIFKTIEFTRGVSHRITGLTPASRNYDLSLAEEEAVVDRGWSSWPYSNTRRANY